MDSKEFMPMTFFSGMTNGHKMLMRSLVIGLEAVTTHI